MAKRWTHIVALAVAFTIMVPGIEWLHAQNPPPAAPAPARSSVTISHVKPEMIDAYQALIKAEAIPAEKKAGVAWRHTYTSTPIGEQGVFVVVRPITNLAQYDEPEPLDRALGREGAAKLRVKTRSMIVSQRTLIQTLQPDLSIDSHATEPAKLVLVQDVYLHPDKGAAYNSLMTSQVLPALKKVGVKDYYVFTTNFGGPFQMRTIVEPIPNFAALEQIPGGRLVRAVGEEAAQRINAQRFAMIQRQESSVMRLVPDLTFTTAPQRTSR